MDERGARWLAILAAGAAVACTGDKDTTSTDECNSVLLGSFPDDGAQDVYYHTVVDAILGQPEESSSIAVTDGSGAAVAGTVQHDDRRVWFTPDAALTAGETYTAVLDWTCGPDQWSFTVGADAGDPVDPAALADHTYLMDLTSARYAWPVGLKAAMQVFLQAHLLLAVDEASASGIRFSAGSALIPRGGDPLEQDVCSVTDQWDTLADFPNPDFSVHLDRMSLEVAGDDFVMLDLTVSGSFTPDGERIVGGAIDGVLDAASLVTELQADDVEDACRQFASQGVDCLTCPDGVTVSCIPMVLDDMTLERLPADLVPRTADDVANDPTCGAAATR
ncbi:MAG: Ig-like domain-containing protein [Myxococcota bacterium]